MRETTDHATYNVIAKAAGVPVAFYSHVPPPTGTAITGIVDKVITVADVTGFKPGHGVHLVPSVGGYGARIAATIESVSPTNSTITVADAFALDDFESPEFGTVEPRCIPLSLVEQGMPMRHRKALVGANVVRWEAPDLGGYVKYSPLSIELETLGVHAHSADDPARIWGRTDGGGWTARLTETLLANDSSVIRSATGHPGPFPALVHLSQEAIVVDSSTAVGDEYELNIVQRGACGTPPQSHEVLAGRAPIYMTAHPTFWAQRQVSIWIAPIDPTGNTIGQYRELYVGEIDGKIHVGATVRFQLKPLTGVLARAPARREPETYELARGKHLYTRGRADKLQIMQETVTGVAPAPATRVLRCVVAEVHDPGEDDQVILVWPETVIQRLNTKLEAGRGAADPDAEADGGHIKTTLRIEKVTMSMEDDVVSDQARVHFASHPRFFHNGRHELPAPTHGDDPVTDEEQIRFGVDLNHHESPRTPDSPDGDWAHSIRTKHKASFPDGYDGQYTTRPWPTEAYVDRREGGMLLQTAPSTIPPSGKEMLLRFVNFAGEWEEHAFLATSVTTIDGLHWLTWDPATAPPSFGQTGNEDRAVIMEAAYARRLPFWRFLLEVLGSGTGVEALGEYDQHVDGAGVLGQRLNVLSLRGIRFPSGFGLVSGEALRDPTKVLRDGLRLAGTAIGIDTGTDGQARLSAFRREAARSDLARFRLQFGNTYAPSGSGIPADVLPPKMNMISVKVANEDGETRDIDIPYNHGINGANRQVFHLSGLHPSGETVDMDLSAVDIGVAAGNAASVLLPAANRLFTLTGEGRRRWTLGVDAARFDVSQLRPYDEILLDSDLIQGADGTYGVTGLSVQVMSVTIPLLDGMAQIVVEESAATGVGWNASALVTAISVDRLTLTIDLDEYVDPENVATGAAQTALSQFEEGDAVKVWPLGNQAAAVEREIATINTTLGTVLLTEALPDIPGAQWGVMVPADFANMAAAHRKLLVMGGADGMVTPGVKAGVIT